MKLLILDRPKEITMFARVSEYRAADGAALVNGFRAVTQELEKIDGFSHAYFLIDSSSGKGMSVTVWDTEQAMLDSSSQADELRQQASEAGGASVESVQNFEISLFTSSPATVDGHTFRRHVPGGEHVGHLES